MNDALQRLIDKDDIRDLMARYARGLDRADWDIVRGTYHADAYDDHGDFKGGVEEFIAYAREKLSTASQVMHFLGSCLIEFASRDVAIVETYFFTAHTLGPEAQKAYGAENTGGPVQISQYGRYVDRAERRNGVWRTARRIVIFESTRLALGEVPPIKSNWAHHHRDQNDPIFRMRAEAGIDHHGIDAVAII